MNPDFQRLMADAARLTRGGDLQAATAAIQSALAGRVSAPAAPPETRDVIDVPSRELPQTAGPSPAGSFTRHRFGEGATHRDYKLYVPPGAGERSLPLVVMLHGCTQDPDDFAAGTAMNELGAALGFYVLYPEQSPKANPQRCWNWFKHNHQHRGSVYQQQPNLGELALGCPAAEFQVGAVPLDRPARGTVSVPVLLSSGDAQGGSHCRCAGALEWCDLRICPGTQCLKALAHPG